MDFDLPDADNNRLRPPREAAINDVVRQDLPVRYAHVTAGDAAAKPGLIGNRSVAPPPDADGLVHVVEIVGLGIDDSTPHLPFDRLVALREARFAITAPGAAFVVLIRPNVGPAASGTDTIGPPPPVLLFPGIRASGAGTNGGTLEGSPV